MNCICRVIRTKTQAQTPGRRSLVIRGQKYEIFSESGHYEGNEITCCIGTDGFGKPQTVMRVHIVTSNFSVGVRTTRVPIVLQFRMRRRNLSALQDRIFLIF